MGHRKIQIQKHNDGWHFEIMPGNNHNQPMGVSPAYPSYNECDNQQKRFCHIVRTKILNDADSPFIVIRKDTSNENYYFQYIDESGNAILSSRGGYTQKANCKKAISSIYKAVIEK